MSSNKPGSGKEHRLSPNITDNMLFSETLDKHYPQVKEALGELFDAVRANQTHEQDLLLVEINGFYRDELEKPLPDGEKLSPFVFGIGGWSYFADKTQYRFFHHYRQTFDKKPRVNFFFDYKTNLEKQQFYDISLQIELMVYLKFWESDVMLRKLYHLSNLARGNNYDWYFRVSKDDSRQNIVRTLIRDPLKNICPKFYQLIKDIYLSQIRNAVAHSQFYIEQQKLGFANHDPENFAPLSQIDFLEWEDRFHKLVLMYSELIEKFKASYKEYMKEEDDKHYGLQVRTTAKDKSTAYEYVKYFDHGDRKDWMWYKIWDKHYRDT